MQREGVCHLHPILLFFMKKTCDFCIRLHPVVDHLRSVLREEEAKHTAEFHMLPMWYGESAETDEIFGKLRIQGYPTILLFVPVPSGGFFLLEYTGPRTYEAIREYAVSGYTNTTCQYKIEDKVRMKLSAELKRLSDEERGRGTWM
jgi:thiol-disulfide isomerase/thioredoxin